MLLIFSVRLPKLFGEVHKGLKKSLFWAFTCFHHEQAKSLFSPILEGKEKNTTAQRLLNLVYSQRTNAMRKLNSVFKNMVKCLRVDDFHNLFREKAAWKPTLYAPWQIISSNTHSPAGRHSLSYFGIQQEETQKPCAEVPAFCDAEALGLQPGDTLNPCNFCSWNWVCP